MPSDKYDVLGPALARIGQAVVDVVGGRPDNIYLYVEAGEGWVDVSVFHDEGPQVRYFDTGDTNLWRLLLDARCLEPVNNRWTGMEYVIEGGKFDAKFQFDDVEKEMAEMGSDSRRQRFLHARYGDKPVVYPPMPEGSMEYRPAT